MSSMAVHAAVLVLMVCVATVSRAAPLVPEEGVKTPPPRADKALEYFQYLLPPFVGDDGDVYDQQERSHEARTEPLLGGKQPLFPDSPIYYIRLPPSPYMYVAGLGYVSQRAQQPAANPFLNLPVNFLANGKPSSIYQWSSPGDYQLPPSTTTTPRPAQAPVVNLDKGPYVFNGRPSDIYVLRDSYNSLYADALQNFYP